MHEWMNDASKGERIEDFRANDLIEALTLIITTNEDFISTT